MGMIKDIYDMIMDLLKGNVQDKKEYFSNHIDPLYEKFTKINRDYVNGFEELQSRLDSRTAPPEELIKFLRERRRDYEDERIYAKSISAELANPENVRYFGELHNAVNEFCKSISSYFSASGAVASDSWYTDFINSVETSNKIGADDSWSSGGFSSNPRKELLNKVNYTLTNHLPTAFKNVTDSYAKLKIKLT